MKGPNVFLFLAAAVAVAASSCGLREPSAGRDEKTMQAKPQPAATALATFGAGCFWCVEAVFQRLEGVISVASGYAGGGVENPTYKQVCAGTTGHAEAVHVAYDPSKVGYDEILEVFWKTHDPTTMDRQGPDVGSQYRSVIFYHDDAQRSLAEKVKKELDASGAFDGPIVTEIVPFTNFYRAEDHHQNFYNENPEQGYCKAFIGPKLEKFRKVFRDKLKKEAAAER